MQIQPHLLPPAALSRRNEKRSCMGFGRSHAQALGILDAWTVERRSTQGNAPAGIVVAIPVRDESVRIAACVEALCRQTRMHGLRVVFLANDCTDDTFHWLGRHMQAWPFATTLLDVRVPVAEQSAGRARWLANHAAVATAAPDGLLFMSDADSCVPPDWVDAYASLLRGGWDAVAGAVDIRSDDCSQITHSLDHRNQLEARYTALLDQIESAIDPVPHDPWPRHFNASGANMAVRLASVRCLDDFPAHPCGEDKALIRALEDHDLRVRHDTGTRVQTSGRLFGRAAGGMADTLRHRAHVPEAPCDERLERADRACQRASLRARWRALHADRRHATTALADFGAAAWLTDTTMQGALALRAFSASWAAVEAQIPLLQKESFLPQQLPMEIHRASDLLDAIRRGVLPDGDARLEMTA